MRLSTLDWLSAKLGFRGQAAMQAANTGNGGEIIYTITAVMTFSTGIFLTAARFVEPLFRYIIWTKYYQFYGD